MSKKLLTCAAIFFLVQVNLFADGSIPRDPIGEVANYKLDRDPHRTSQSIRQGIVDLKVLRYLPQFQSGGVYEVELAYDVLVSMVGRQHGKKLIEVPEKYFTQEFWDELRKNGAYNSDQFKIKHEGYGDAKTMDGRVYQHCDKLYFYDIKTDLSESELLDFIQQLFVWTLSGLGFDVSPYSEVKDLKIRGFFKDGVPVLHGVKLDISGTVDGLPAKAGLDYIKQGTNSEF